MQQPDLITQKLINAYKYMKGPGKNDLFNLVYKTSQYPYFSMIQIIWSCYVVYHETKCFKKSFTLCVKQFFIAFFMSFLPRHLFALMIHVPPPLQRNPDLFVEFSISFLVIVILSCGKLVEIFSFILSFLQGVNTARFYSTIVRNLSDLPEFEGNPYIILPCLSILVLDHMLNFIVGRKLFKFGYSSMSNLMSSFRILVITLIFWACTNKNYFTKYVGFFVGKWPSLIYAAILGIYSFPVDSAESKETNERRRTNDQPTSTEKTNYEETSTTHAHSE